MAAAIPLAIGVAGSVFGTMLQDYATPDTPTAPEPVPLPPPPSAPTSFLAAQEELSEEDRDLAQEQAEYRRRVNRTRREAFDQPEQEFSINKPTSLLGE